MKRTEIIFAGKVIPLYLLDTLVIGSGCAGLCAADTLYDNGRRDIAILTEGINMGTSRNAGSDKQTFYKLSLAPDESDSVGEMAKTLFSCGGMHGDTALIEAAGSIRSFFKLVNYGVPFPTDRFGVYVGYKTDHDPRRRATSAGPYTSKYMTEALERSVRSKSITLLDGYSAIRLLTDHGRCYGVLAIDESRVEGDGFGFTAILINNVVMATGGPAGIYASSVYPESQTGMTGMSVEAGAKCENLMDWQYGLSSTKFRWNVSGTYQQVLPRYITIDHQGYEREFLNEYFDNPVEALNMVFLKGYQWPFDVRKIPGSSIIDVIIHHETLELGNHVYMDFSREPSALVKFGFKQLSPEAYDYLDKSHALIPLPIERLAQMNKSSIELYESNGIDLYREPLEVKVCAQHNNGGVAVDANWQSSIKGLYVAGEAAGTFGAYRPGGTALASTQTGAQRAAEHIAYTTVEHEPDATQLQTDRAAEAFIRLAIGAIKPGSSSDIYIKRELFQREMTACAAQMRDMDGMQRLLDKRSMQIQTFFDDNSATSPRELSQLLRNRDIMLTQCVVLSAMLLTADKMGSRGSGLLTSGMGCKIGYHLDDIKYVPAKSGFEGYTIQTVYDGNGFTSELCEVRSIPESDDWFENVWKEYMERTSRLRA